MEILQRENLVPAETVVIALTANAVVGAKEQYLSGGFNDYLSKPIELKDRVVIQKNRNLKNTKYKVVNPQYQHKLTLEKAIQKKKMLQLSTQPFDKK